MANSSHYTPGKIAPQRRPNCQLSLSGEAYDFIISTPVENITFILEAARLNSALAAEGKSKKYGLNINGTFSEAVKNGLLSNDLMSEVIINTVAASDARMGGAPVVAMSNFGSGNQDRGDHAGGNRRRASECR